MANLHFSGPGHWFPDADATRAPTGALLRADNLVPDEAGALALRKGSAIIYSGLEAQRAHSLYTPTLQGVVYRMAGIDAQVYRQTYDPVGFSPFGDEFDGEG